MRTVWSVAGLLWLAGCGVLGGSNAGTLAVRLADAPDPTITALNITIDRVEANVDGEWVAVTDEPRSFDLRDLAHDDTLLGAGRLPPGRYTQVRLFPSSAAVTDNEGVHPVTLSSAVRSGVTLDIDYEITPHQETSILLDFNLVRSLRRQDDGAYCLQPVIPAVVKALSGTVTGTLICGGGTPVGAEVTATYTAGSRYPIGTEVNVSTTGSDGRFTLWALRPGVYTVVVRWTDPSDQLHTLTLDGVSVEANQNTALGVRALP